MQAVDAALDICAGRRTSSPIRPYLSFRHTQGVSECYAPLFSVHLSLLIGFVCSCADLGLMVLDAYDISTGEGLKMLCATVTLKSRAISAAVNALINS
jgi:hypothetical protein